jgi:hypothetical protein
MQNGHICDHHAQLLRVLVFAFNEEFGGMNDLAALANFLRRL